MKIVPIAKILPYQIRQRLLTCAIKAELAQAESELCRESAAYRRCIADIDKVTAEARAQFPHLYRA